MQKNKSLVKIYDIFRLLMDILRNRLQMFIKSDLLYVEKKTIIHDTKIIKVEI